MTEETPWIVNTTDETFEADVYARSQLGLVVVDFWAEWCAPCRMLAPLLEQLAQEYEGRFTLVKANTDHTQQAASQFSVSGIPAVFAVLDGERLDHFQGVLPEDALRRWLDQCLRQAELAEIKGLLEEAPEAAEEKLRAVLEQTPDDGARLLLAESLMRQDRDAESLEVLAHLEKRGFLEPEAEKMKATLDLKQKSSLDVATARAEAEAQPGDFSLQLTLAEALAGQRQYEQAFEICLVLVAQDRQQTGEKARQLMIEVFRTLPEDSEITREYRRKLSMALY